MIPFTEEELKLAYLLKRQLCGPFSALDEEIQNGIRKIHEWDVYYLNMARYVATKSKDPSTKAGAVIVRPNHSVCSIGFNGFPRGMKDTPALLADREKKYSRTVHCEVNAQIFTKEDLRGYTLYTWPFSCCDRCAVQMIQAGIKRFVFPEIPEDKKGRWGTSMSDAQGYMREAGCLVDEVPLSAIPNVVLE